MKIRRGTGASFEVIGRLKEAPTVHKTNNGDHVANIVLAVSDVQKNEHNQTQDYTEWYKVTVWGDAANYIKNTLSPGMRLKLSANVKMVKETVIGRNGKNYAFYISHFHANHVDVMDVIRKKPSIEEEKNHDEQQAP